MTETVRIREIP